MRNRPTTPPLLFKNLIAAWLREQAHGMMLTDLDENAPWNRGLCYLDIVTKAPIAEIALDALRFVLHVDADGLDLKIGCEVRAAKPVDEPRPTYRLTLALKAVPTDADLAAAWKTIVDRSIASEGPGRRRRGWCADVKRVIFYHPHAPDARRSCFNSAYDPFRFETMEDFAKRRPVEGERSVEQLCADFDAALELSAGVSHEEALAAMKREAEAEALAV